MQNLLKRYTEEQQRIIETYWETIRFTRTTGKISDGIKQREYTYWAKYEPSLVMRALTIHIQKYPNIKENYTRGILRNLQGGVGVEIRQESYAAHDKQRSVVTGSRDQGAEAAFRRRLNL